MESRIRLSDGPKTLVTIDLFTCIRSEALVEASSSPLIPSATSQLKSNSRACVDFLKGRPFRFL